MLQRIRRVSIGQTAKVVGVLYALLGLVFVPFFLIVAAVAPEQAGFGFGFALVVPVLYGVIGFIFTAITCALYNWVAGMLGGIEVQLESDSAVS